ncbi:MAG: N-acetylmuramoyl-L-alanine amidase, partial [Candidatus Aenigmatarchaeota archaeon]
MKKFIKKTLKYVGLTTASIIIGLSLRSAPAYTQTDPVQITPETVHTYQWPNATGTEKPPYQPPTDLSPLPDKPLYATDSTPIESSTEAVSIPATSTPEMSTTSTTPTPTSEIKPPKIIDYTTTYEKCAKKNECQTFTKNWPEYWRTHTRSVGTRKDKLAGTVGILRKETGCTVLHTTEVLGIDVPKRLAELGYTNLYIYRNGTIAKIVPLDRRAYHAGESLWNGKRDLSSWCIGIEVEGHDSIAYGTDITDAQKRSLDELVPYLKKTYNLKDDDFLPHVMLANGGEGRGRKQDGVRQYSSPEGRAEIGLEPIRFCDQDVSTGRIKISSGTFIGKISPTDKY